MKLSPHAFTRYWDVHAWIGVAAGIVLHVMFFAGGFSLFYEELCDWQEPEGSPAAVKSRKGRAAAGATPPARVSALVERALRAGGVGPEGATAGAAAGSRPREIAVGLPGPHQRFVEVSWIDPAAAGGRREVRVDPATGAVAPETSRLGRILFWLHFLYHPKAAWGMYVAGGLGVALLLAIVTGVLIHLKDLLRQLHQFRPERSTRVLWSDLHKVLGVMGLPFQAMYALTGALLCLMSVMLALAAGPLFGGDAAAARRSLWGELPDEDGGGAGPGGEAAGEGAAATRGLDLDQLLARAREVAPGFEPRYAELRARRVSLWGERPGGLFTRGDVVLRVADGALIEDSSVVAPTPGGTLTRWVVGLHYVWFGGLGAKILHALLAAAGCFTILSGNWIWLARRSAAFGPGADVASAAGRAHRLLSKLTLGVGGGVILAAAALFCANRVAPPAVRPAAEAWTFFGTWALAAALFLLRAEARGGWVGLLRVAGAGFVAAPLLGALATGRPAASGVDAGLVALGLALLGIAVLVRRYGVITTFGRATRVALAAAREARRGA